MKRIVQIRRYKMMLAFLITSLLLLNQPAFTKDDIKLIKAAKKNKTALVKYLLKKGSDANIKDPYNRTALMHASRKGNIYIVKALLEKGAKVNEKDNDGMTPLMFASRAGHADVVKVLLKKGAKVNEKDNDGMTPLMFALRGGHTDNVQILCGKGARIIVKNNNQTTMPVHFTDYAISKIRGDIRTYPIKGANLKIKAAKENPHVIDVHGKKTYILQRHKLYQTEIIDTTWFSGVEHTIIGKVQLSDYKFYSSTDSPLVFLVDYNKGYVYQRGDGRVITPHGQIVLLSKGKTAIEEYRNNCTK